MSTLIEKGNNNHSIAGSSSFGDIAGRLELTAAAGGPWFHSKANETVVRRLEGGQRARAASCNNNSNPSSADDLDDDEHDYKQNIIDAEPNRLLKSGSEFGVSGGDQVHATNTAAAMGGLSVPNHGLSAAFHGYHAHNHHNNSKSPFLLPAQLYKSLFANAVLQQNPDKMCSHPFPRNLLFSYAEKSPNSDFEADENKSLGDEVGFLVYTGGGEHASKFGRV